jgi:urease accessory protein
MVRASAAFAPGDWDVSREVDRVLLDFDQRFRRRIVLATVAGAELLLDLPEALRLRDGAGLGLESGGFVRVCASDEALMEIRAAGGMDLARIAWHLGNRHLPVQFASGCLRIRADHVIAAMVQGLGGEVRAVEGPFDPEAGAYSVPAGHHGGGHHAHGADHGH